MDGPDRTARAHTTVGHRRHRTERTPHCAGYSWMWEQAATENRSGVGTHHHTLQMAVQCLQHLQTPYRAPHW